MHSAYVIDTSVLVHDPHALRGFRDTTVGIPIFVVMELDELKANRRPEVAASARMASRFIWGLREYGNFGSSEGVLHPDLNTRFMIISDRPGRGSPGIARASGPMSMDMQILASALALKRELNTRVVLVSKDVNLRLLADFEGLEAEDYDTDRIELSDLYTGYRVVDTFDENEVARAYLPDVIVNAADFGLSDLLPNEFVIFRGGGREFLFRHGAGDGTLRVVPREFGRANSVQARNLEQRMALSLLMDPEIQLVTLVGKAGTGKTFLALAAALSQLHRGPKGAGYDRILLSKPVVAMGNDIGYLPGDFETKMQPWMTSFFDNLDQVIPANDEGAASKGASQNDKNWKILFETGQLEIQAIHSIRGRSIPRAFMMIDEAQNLTPHQVKTIITRAAHGTKVVLAGDPFQVDNHFLDQHSNGLVYVTERLKNSDITGTVFFTKGERGRLAELAATSL